MPAVVLACSSRVFSKTHLQGAATSLGPRFQLYVFARLCVCGCWEVTGARESKCPQPRTNNRTLAATSQCILCLALLSLQFLYRDYFDQLQPRGSVCRAFLKVTFTFPRNPTPLVGGLTAPRSVNQMCHLKATMSTMKACTVWAAVMRNVFSNVPLPAAPVILKEKHKKQWEIQKTLTALRCGLLLLYVVSFFTFCSLKYMQQAQLSTLLQQSILSKGKRKFCLYTSSAPRT